MKTPTLFLLMMIALSGFSQTETGNTALSTNQKSAQTDTLFNFENYQLGQTPPGWSVSLTGRGKMCSWSILSDNGNKVLAQTSSETPDYRFNIVTNNTLSYKNVEISVRFKAVKGNGDQGGGPVWRYVDENNYYVARANPLENNYRLYKVVNGNRIQLKSANIKMTDGKWYNLEIVMKGNNIQCYFNGKPKLQATDNTFKDAGKIGLWTKSDAATWFDELNIQEVK